jgi:hypothetical protein
MDESILDEIKTDWKGIQKIIVWSLKQSSALVLFIIGFIATGIGAVIRITE